MSVKTELENFRFEEMKAVFRFIETCTVEEIAYIISEIRVVHDNLCVWDEDNKTFSSVQSISINGESVQLNLKF